MRSDIIQSGQNTFDGGAGVSDGVCGSTTGVTIGGIIAGGITTGGRGCAGILSGPGKIIIPGGSTIVPGGLTEGGRITGGVSGMKIGGNIAGGEITGGTTAGGITTGGWGGTGVSSNLGKIIIPGGRTIVPGGLTEGGRITGGVSGMKIEGNIAGGKITGGTIAGVVIEGISFGWENKIGNLKPLKKSFAICRALSMKFVAGFSGWAVWVWIGDPVVGSFWMDVWVPPTCMILNSWLIAGSGASEGE